MSSPRRSDSPLLTPLEGEKDDRWKVFLAFWVLAGLTLVTIAIVMVVAVDRSHRIAAFIGALGVGCLAIGNIVRLGARRQP